MLKYVKKFENKRPEPVLLPTDASELSHRGGKIRHHSPIQNIRWVRLYKKAEGPHGPAYRFNTYIVCFGVNRRGDEMQSNLVFLSRPEMPKVRAPASFRSIF